MSKRRIGLSRILVGLFLLFSLSGAAKYEPAESYERQEVEGWTVRVSRALADHPQQRDRALALLRVKLFEITRVVPAPALAHLRKVPFWLEWQDKGFPCMCYHPSRDWLAEHGYNPEKVSGVEIANTENFLTWSLDQPWMVLHELAHAYHDRVLGFENAEVKHAYEAAVKSGRYEKVLHFDGKAVRAYALTDEKEYFAECSEAYFGTNDFYPFVRAELREHDPVGFQTLDQAWGTPERSGQTHKP